MVRRAVVRRAALRRAVAFFFRAGAVRALRRVAALGFAAARFGLRAVAFFFFAAGGGLGGSLGAGSDGIPMPVGCQPPGVIGPPPNVSPCTISVLPYFDSELLLTRARPA